MNITWHGQSCFELTIQNKKQGQINIVIDPIKKKKGDIFLFTHKPFNYPDNENNPFIITGPGEYEIKEIFIQGINSQKEKTENTIYKIEVGQIQFCHLGNLTQDELNEKQVEKLGSIDILFAPTEKTSVINQIEPKIVIPMLYEKVDDFLKVVGEKSIEPLDKLSIKSKDLKEQEKMRVIVLKS